MEYPIDELIIKYLSGTLTEEEQVILDKWRALPENQQLLDQLSDPEWTKKELHQMQAINEENAYRKLSQIYTQQDIPITIQPTRSNRAWYYVAATLALLIGAATWFFFSNNKNTSNNHFANTQERFKNDVQPGGNRAILTLADGNRVVLDKAANGLLTQQGNTTIIKSDNGQITYRQGINSQRQDQITYNTITTPRGGQFMVSLPDGSKAWLNAASSLRFPTSFTGAERIVELTGEGYFEVASNKQKPFKVFILPSSGGSGGTQVQVLGTHFNINAYTEEEAIKTTLLEGSVKVTSGPNTSLLKPGDQAQVNRQGTLKTVQPDLEQTMAWHNGGFAFRSSSITTIMHQAQRWYDIEVLYEGKVGLDQALNGDIPRNVSLTQFLTILEETGSMHFRIEGKTVTVMP